MKKNLIILKKIFFTLLLISSISTSLLVVNINHYDNNNSIEKLKIDPDTLKQISTMLSKINPSTSESLSFNENSIYSDTLKQYLIDFVEKTSSDH